MGRRPSARIPIGLKKDGLASDAADARKTILGALTPVVDVGALAASAIRGVSSAISGAIRVGVDYEQSIAEVTTIVDRSATSTRELEKITKDLAATYGGPAKEQARALYQTISAGITDTTKAAELLEVANELAIGGLTDTTTAVDALTSVVNAFGPAVTDARDVADAFFVAIRAGKTDATQLASVIGSIAPAAKAVGVEFDEMLGVLASITTQGIKTTEAATSMVGMFAALQKQTPKATAEAKRIGIEWSVAALRAKGLAKFLNEITNAARFNDSTLIKLFGRVEAVKGVLAATANEGKKTAETLELMDMRAGAAAGAMGVMADTTAQRFRKIAGGIDAAKVELSEYLIKNESFTDLLDDIEEGLQNIVEEIRENGPQITRTVDAFVEGVRTTAQILKDHADDFGLLLKVLVAAKLVGGAAGMAKTVSAAVGGGAIGGAATGGALGFGAGAAGGAGLGVLIGKSALALLPAVLTAIAAEKIIGHEAGEAALGRISAGLVGVTRGTPSFRSTRLVGEGEEHVSDEFGASIVAGVRGAGAAGPVAPTPKQVAAAKKRRKELSEAIAADLNDQIAARKAAADQEDADQLAGVDRWLSNYQAAADLKKEIDDKSRKDRDAAERAANKQSDRNLLALTESWQMAAGVISSSMSGAFVAIGQAIGGEGEGLSARLKQMAGDMIVSIGMGLIQIGTTAMVGGLIGSVVPWLAPVTGGPAAIGVGAAAAAVGIGVVAAGTALGGNVPGAGATPAAPSAGAGAPSRGFGTRSELPGVDALGQPTGRGTDTATVVNIRFNTLPGDERRTGRAMVKILRQHGALLPTGS